MTYNTPDWPALPPLSALVGAVHCMDALELLALLPDASVDAVFTINSQGETEFLCYNKRKESALRDAANIRGQYAMGVAHMPHYITRPCPVCGKEYRADTQRLKHGRQTTCSRKCSYELRSDKLSTSVEVECLFCNKVVARPPSQLHTKTFCSTECHDAWRIAKRTGIKIKDPHKVKALKETRCAICGTRFHFNKNVQKYCSRQCFETAHRQTMKGAGNPSYIDGRSVVKNYNAGSRWHEIRFQVYKRDNFTCQRCGVKCISKASSTPETSHTIIQCHHIEPYKKSRNNNFSNLITLCLRCHRQVHNEMEGD